MTNARIEVSRTEHFTTQVRVTVVTIPVEELGLAQRAGLNPTVYSVRQELSDMTIAEAKDGIHLVVHTLVKMFHQIGEAILDKTPTAVIEDKFGLLPSRKVDPRAESLIPPMTDEQMEAVRHQIMQTSAVPKRKTSTLRVKETPKVKGKRKRSTAARRVK